MENMDKRLTVLKWVLIYWPKIPQIPPKLICPNCLPKPKSFEFRWKKVSLSVRSPCVCIYCICCPNCLVCSALLLTLTTHPHTTGTSASGIPTVRRHQRRASAHCDTTVRFIQKLHFHRIVYYWNCMYYSIVKDLGVNFKIVQNRPTVKAVCTKISNFFLHICQ